MSELGRLIQSRTLDLMLPRVRIAVRKVVEECSLTRRGRAVAALVKSDEETIAEYEHIL